MNLQIYDGFASQAAEDTKIANQIEADKNLQAMQISSKSSSLLQTASSTAPDAAAEVALEKQMNLQIHDDFAKQAEESKQVQQAVEHNKELAAIQVGTAPDAAAEV